MLLLLRTGGYARNPGCHNYPLPSCSWAALHTSSLDERVTSHASTAATSLNNDSTAIQVTFGVNSGGRCAWGRCFAFYSTRALSKNKQVCSTLYGSNSSYRRDSRVMRNRKINVLLIYIGVVLSTSSFVIVFLCIVQSVSPSTSCCAFR